MQLKGEPGQSDFELSGETEHKPSLRQAVGALSPIGCGRYA